MKIHHSAICVDDIAKATDWYRSIMDFEIEYQDESWALLSFENSKVALVLPSQHPPHLAFEHSRAAEFGPLKTHRDGTASVYVDDPFGNTIELMKLPTDEQGFA